MKTNLKSQNLAYHQRLAYNTKYSLAHSIIQSSVCFVCSVLLARYLGVKDYGIIVIANYLILFVYSLFGNDLSGVKLISQHKSNGYDFGVILKGIFLYTLIFALIYSLGMIGLYFFPSNFIENNIKQYILSITIIVVMNLFVGMWSSFWDGFQRMDWAILTTTVPHIIRTLCFIFLILANSGLKHILWTWAGVWGIYPTLVLPLIFWIFIKKNSISIRDSPKQFPHKRYLMYGLYLKIPGLLKSLAPLAISFYLGHIMMDTYEIGLYGVAVCLVSGITVLSMPLARALFPNLSQSHGQGKQTYLIEISNKSYQYLGLFVLLLIWPVLLLRRNLISLIYGQNYLRAAEIIAYLGIAVFFDSLKSISSVILNATDKASIVALTETFGMIILFAVGSILIRFSGITGAAITLAITSALTSIAMLILVQKCSQIKTYSYICKCLVALCAIGLTVYLKAGPGLTSILLLISLYPFFKGFSVSEMYNLSLMLLGLKKFAQYKQNTKTQ